MTDEGHSLGGSTNTPQLDFSIRDEGTLVMFEPISRRAQDWWDDSVESPNWSKLGNSYAVDRRMAQAICIGLMEAQFEIKGA
jgi:hypothetical protein